MITTADLCVIPEVWECVCVCLCARTSRPVHCLSACDDDVLGEDGVQKNKGCSHQNNKQAIRKKS